MRKRIKKAQEQKEAQRKMTCLLVKAGNCPKCQAIVYQRGRSACCSLPAATLPLLNTLLRHTCHCSAMFLYQRHACAHTALPSCPRDLSVPLRDNEEQRASLLEHVRQVPNWIHPSSPAHLIWSVRRQRALGQGERGWRLWLKKESTKKDGKRHGEREEYKRDLMIVLFKQTLT